MAVLCLSHVLFKVVPWCNFRGFLPFALMVLQLLHKSQRLLWGMRFRWGRTYSEDLSDPSVDAMTVCDCRELNSVIQRFSQSHLLPHSVSTVSSQILCPPFCLIFLFICCSSIFSSLHICWLGDYVTVSTEHFWNNWIWLIIVTLEIVLF